MAKLGGADGGNFVKKKNFKIKDGDNVYRIFPSIGLNGKEPNGKWSVFHRVHFGYKNSEGKMRVFESSLVKNKEKMITSPDAALERIEKLKAELEKAKAAKNTAMIQKLAPLISGQKPLYNLDSNHHMNVINENGEIGILKLRHKGKLALDAVIKQLRAKGVEPLGQDSGRFFVINRSGTGLETTYTVTVKTKALKIDGVGEVQQEIVHVITPEIINRLDAEAGDLENLFVKPSSEEVAQIVAESDLFTGKSPAIDRIFSKGNNAAAAAQTSSEEEPEGEEEGESTTTASVQTQTQTQTQAPAQAPAAQQAAPAQAQAPATTVKLDAPTAPAPQPAVSEMSDEEFLRSLGA